MSPSIPWWCVFHWSLQHCNLTTTRKSIPQEAPSSIDRLWFTLVEWIIKENLLQIWVLLRINLKLHQCVSRVSFEYGDYLPLASLLLGFRSRNVNMKTDQNSWSHPTTPKQHDFRVDALSTWLVEAMYNLPRIEMHSSCMAQRRGIAKSVQGSWGACWKDSISQPLWLRWIV